MLSKGVLKDTLKFILYLVMSPHNATERHSEGKKGHSKSAGAKFLFSHKVFVVSVSTAISKIHINSQMLFSVKML